MAGEIVICLLVYDITHDGTRSKVSDVCLDYGLERIQYSAFRGELSRALQEELFRKVRKRLGKKEGKIQLFPLCERDVRGSLEVINRGAAEAPPEQEAVARLSRVGEGGRRTTSAGPKARSGKTSPTAPARAWPRSARRRYPRLTEEEKS